MIGFYNYTVILTYMGLASAVVGMVTALKGNLLVAVVCLMVSGACDMFDGKVARTKKDRTHQEKQFGIQLDSLCDIVCFGVLPCMIGFAAGVKGPFGTAYMVLYVLAALIRLAYFNVMEEERQKTTETTRKYYQGLPVTSAAVIFPVLFAIKPVFGRGFVLAYEIVLIIVALLFVIDFKVKKMDLKGMIVLLIVGTLIFIRLLLGGVCL